MHSAPDAVLKTLADPTRRAIFERLARGGEQTVRVLTGHSGVSQPAVSKHLAVLRLAGLVRDRREGRQTHYSAEPKAWRPSWTGSVSTAPSGGTGSTFENLLNRMDQ